MKTRTVAVLLSSVVVSSLVGVDAAPLPPGSTRITAEVTLTLEILQSLDGSRVTGTLYLNGTTKKRVPIEGMGTFLATEGVWDDMNPVHFLVDIEVREPGRISSTQSRVFVGRTLKIESVATGPDTIEIVARCAITDMPVAGEVFA